MNFTELWSKIRPEVIQLLSLLLSERGYTRWVRFSYPLTSSSWDGDSYSTMSKTKIDLSSEFGVPDGIKAVDIRIACRDENSASTPNLFVAVSPNSDAGSVAVIARPSGLPNDYYAEGRGICPCLGGDIYVQISASGTSTMDVHLQINGYEI